MKLRLIKNRISTTDFKLTADDIEQQIDADLFRYKKEYSVRYGNLPQLPFDVDNFIKELWGIEIVYESLPQLTNEEILGFFEPEKRRIVIDARACNNPRRISFTVAHEAGHLSLHAFLFVFNAGKLVGKKDNKLIVSKSLDRQADIYAASLLAPQQEIYNFLQEKGLSSNNLLVTIQFFPPVFFDSARKTTL